MIPLLAVAAYLPVLPIGFLSDDLVLLYQAEQSGINLGVFAPAPNWYIYRPLGGILIWQVGWQLWGFNPLPYHIVGLLLHAGVSSTLALWLCVVTRRQSLALLAGALFAVLPLHMEAVGWIAAQWDAWAALFLLLSLWLFTKWWSEERRAVVFYILALLLYALAIFTKESTLTFLPVFAISAWLVSGGQPGRRRARLALAMLPFCGVLLSNVSIRLFSWGHLGGYARTRAEFGDLLPVFWDHLIIFMRTLLSPVSPVLLGQATSQVVGAVTSIALLIAIARYGPAAGRALMIAGAWVLLALLPVLSLAIVAEDLQQNRVLYLPAAGYCVGVASLMHAALQSAHRWRSHALVAFGTLLLVSIVTCWVHLMPWHTATAQVTAVESHLKRLIPVWGAARPEVWYVENTPDSFRGAYVLRLGLGISRYFENGKTAVVQPIADALQARIADDDRDAFAMRFNFDSEENRFHVEYIAGITGDNPPPSSSEAGEHLRVWDFRSCAPDALAGWQVAQAEGQCNRGDGLTLNPTTDDPMLLNDAVNLDVRSSGARFVRLRISTHPADQLSQRHIIEWFWKGPADDYSGERVRAMLLRQDGKPHVYWTFIPAGEAGDVISGLRFDPVNGKVPSVVQWIAVDLVR